MIIRLGGYVTVRGECTATVLFNPTYKSHLGKEIRRMADITELSSSNFEQEVLQSGQPVLVDFWAPWCGPCRMIGPLVEELAAENADSLKVAKINIDDAQDIAATYGVSSIPTLMIFKNGDVVDRFVGVQPKNRLQEAVDQAVG